MYAVTNIFRLADKFSSAHKTKCAIYIIHSWVQEHLRKTMNDTEVVVCEYSASVQWERETKWIYSKNISFMSYNPTAFNKTRDYYY